MKRLAAILFALLIMSEAIPVAHGAPQTPAPPTGTGTDNPNKGVADPRDLATAPPGNPVTRIYIPTRADISHDYEDWNIEFTISYWALKASGNVETASTPGDLVNDLGIQGYKSIPIFRMNLKPARKHQLNIEAIPFQLNGGTRLNRQLNFLGNTFNAQDQITSQIKLNWINANYQYDVISKKSGFLGIILGAGYLAANAKVTSLISNMDAANYAKAYFPVAGAAFRTYLGHDGHFNLNGEIKGMDFGNDGNLLQTTIQAGWAITHRVTLQGGYSLFDANIHNKYETEGVKANMRGPVVSLQWRNR